MSENAVCRISRSIAAGANPSESFSFGIHADGSREASREIVARERRSKIVYLSLICRLSVVYLSFIHSIVRMRSPHRNRQRREKINRAKFRAHYIHWRGGWLVLFCAIRKRV